MPAAPDGRRRASTSYRMPDEVRVLNRCMMRWAAQVELPPVNFTLAVGHDVCRAVVEENQIQIGAVAQLQPPSLP